MSVRKDPLDFQDQPEQSEILELTEHQVLQALTVQQDDQDLLAFKESQEPLVSQVFQVSPATLDDQEPKEHQEPLEHQEYQDLMAKPDQLDHKESEVFKEPQVKLGPRV